MLEPTDENAESDEEDRCVRCQRDAYDVVTNPDGDDPETFGWNSDEAGRFICPGCYMPADSLRFVSIVLRGVKLASAKGRPYSEPALLAKAIDRLEVYLAGRASGEKLLGG